MVTNPKKHASIESTQKENKYEEMLTITLCVGVLEHVDSDLTACKISSVVKVSLGQAV